LFEWPFKAVKGKVQKARQVAREIMDKLTKLGDKIKESKGFELVASFINPDLVLFYGFKGVRRRENFTLLACFGEKSKVNFDLEFLETLAFEYFVRESQESRANKVEFVSFVGHFVGSFLERWYVEVSTTKGLKRYPLERDRLVGFSLDRENKLVA